MRYITGTNIVDKSNFSETEKHFLNIPLQNPDISWFMRATLTDWMREAGKDLGLRRKTIHNSISLLDRYLMFSTNFPRNRLQLLGVTCLFSASKIEEVEAPTLQNFSYMTTNTFGCEEIAQMELEICKKVGWLLITGPYSPSKTAILSDGDSNPAYFIQKYPKIDPENIKELSLEIKTNIINSFVRGNLNTVLGAMTEEWDFWLSENLNQSQHEENNDLYIAMLSQK
jgi:hypothetical protein